jgi:hypothetical protein
MKPVVSKTPPFETAEKVVDLGVSKTTLFETDLIRVQRESRVKSFYEKSVNYFSDCRGNSFRS